MTITRRTGIAAIAAATFTMLSGTMLAGSAHAEDVILKYSSYNPLTHFVNKDVILPWGEEIAKVTEGRVKFEPLPKMVGTPQSQYDVAADGLADITYITLGYTPGRFDFVALGELPFLTNDPEVGSAALFRFYDKYIKPMNKFEQVHVLSMFGSSAGAIFSRSPISSADEIRGKKIRSPLSTTTPMLEAVGAVPIQKPVSEAYEMLSTGAMDASFSGPDQAIAYNLGEVTDYLTIIPGGLYNSIQIMAVNKATWEKISEADRAAIEKISGEAFARTMGAAFKKPVQAGIAKMKEGNNKVIEASPEFTAYLKKAWEPIEKSALERAEKAGLANPAAALEDYRSMIAELEKTVN